MGKTPLARDPGFSSGETRREDFNGQTSALSEVLEMVNSKTALVVLSDLQ